MKNWHVLSALVASLVIGLTGCATLDEKQRGWIFQPSDRTWGGGTAAAVGMSDVWIDFQPKKEGFAAKLATLGTDDVAPPARLHGLWLDADTATAADQQPVLLYLHGARFNVTGSAPRMRRMQELGFSVLAVDYRGFGKSTAGLPSEDSAYEDARAAWDWLAQKYPDRPRYVFGHSLGGPIAIHLANEVSDERGTIVESTFTSITDVLGSTSWGWLPWSLLVTQRLAAVDKVSQIGSPLLVVHGSEDKLIPTTLGKKLYDSAAEPKRFVLVEGGSHHNTNAVGQPQYREALAELMGIRQRPSVSRQALLPTDPRASTQVNASVP
jgi:alpha-beta hydrolase superfamily lysophospholipase